MLAFRSNDPLFTHVIAANSAVEAERVAISGTLRPSATITQWHSPDAWTKRAIQSATNPCIINTIPRFVLDTDDGPQYVDIDDIYPGHSREARIKWRNDSPIHHEWLRACIVEHEGTKADVLKNYIVDVATERDPKRHALLTRALAGAWGLGPVPDWYAAILPALIALDTESKECANAFHDDVFDMDRVDLINELDRCALIPSSVPRWFIDAICTIEAGLSSDGSDAVMRILSRKAMRTIGWLTDGLEQGAS